MKLKAIRLSEVGPFRGGVALEGLSGGLDVVPGPNEAGKSTIFRAIDTVMRVPHTRTAEKVRDLAPLQGGAPLIEVEFEAAATRWRLRKRYLAHKLVELVDLGGGTLLRGADAEFRLAELVAGRLGRDRMLGLLWVGQRQSFELPADKTQDLSKSLGRLIEDEIADAGDNGQVRRLREAVAAALDALVSRANRRPAAGKPYKAAIDARDRAAQAFERAQAAAGDARSRLDRLQAAEARAAHLGAPQAIAARNETLANLRRVLAESQRAEEALQRASLVVEARVRDHERAQQQADMFAAAIEEAARLEQRGQAAAAELKALGASLAAHTAAAEEAEAARAATEAALAEAQALVDAHDAFVRRQAARATADARHQRLELARETARRLAEIERAIAAEPVSEQAIVQMRQAQADVERLRARRAAALPRITIDYEAGAEGSIRSGGLALDASGEIAAAATVELVIAGIGRIIVEAPVAGASDLAAACAAAETRLGALLRDAGVDDLTGAEDRFVGRQRLVADQAALSAQLALAAPEGVTALAAAHAAMPDDGDPPEPVPPAGSRQAAAAELARLRQSLREGEARRRAAEAARHETATRLARLESESSASGQRLAQIIASLPPPAERAVAAAQTKAQAAAAKAAHDEALRERSAWASSVLAPVARAALERDIAAAAQAARDVEDERGRVAAQIVALASALERDRQDGVEAELEETRAALAAAEARVSAYAREVAELELIDQLLAEEAEAARAAHLRPVLDRVQAYAAPVFPAARFELGEKLEVKGMVRDGALQASARLSGGTLEQIAVLVRLGYARLLADRGEGLPLVLDDALVYSDAERFRAMFTVLSEAARHHQVILLTCQQDRVEALAPRPEMKILQQQAWTPAGHGQPA